MLALINFILQLYLIILILRLCLEWSGISGRNPFCRWLVKLTQPLIKPLQRVLPSRGHFNWSCLVIMIIVAAIQLSLFTWFSLHTLPPVIGLCIAIIGNLLYLTASVFFWGIIANAILSWIGMMNHNFAPLQEALYYLTRPLLQPAQRLIPPIGGIDLSPIPVLIILQLFNSFIAAPLMAFGLSLVF